VYIQVVSNKKRQAMAAYPFDQPVLTGKSYILKSTHRLIVFIGLKTHIDNLGTLILPFILFIK
jgi:hypothetical protein